MGSDFPNLLIIQMLDTDDQIFDGFLNPWILPPHHFVYKELLSIALSNNVLSQYIVSMFLVLW